MIHFTTFILAIFLSRIARAEPQAFGDVIPPELPTLVEQFNIPIVEVTYNNIYDNPNASTKSVTCKNFYPKYPQFQDIFTFPDIGGAFDILTPGSPNCGKCWKLTNRDNGHSVVITAINHAKHGFDISDAAYKRLDDGHVGPPLKHVEARALSSPVCGL
jgi:hypothetical protein